MDTKMCCLFSFNIYLWFVTLHELFVKNTEPILAIGISYSQDLHNTQIHRFKYDLQLRSRRNPKKLLLHYYTHNTFPNSLSDRTYLPPLVYSPT